MIELIMLYGTEVVLVRVKGKSVDFGSTSFGAKLANIDGLKLSHAGVVKEFPDLKGNENWRKEAIKRFKNKIASINDEREIAEYIMQDLKKYGYKPKYIQKAGFRREAIR